MEYDQVLFEEWNTASLLSFPYLMLALTILLELHGWESHALWDHDQLEVFPGDIYHLVLQQDQCLREEAVEGECSSLWSGSLADINAADPIGEVLSRVHHWAQSQQSHQVHPLAVHAGEQGKTECIPAVSKQSSYVPLNANYLCSLTQATEMMNIRLVFTAVEETILWHAVMDSGILPHLLCCLLSVVCCHCQWVFLYMYVRAILTILIVIDSRSFVTLHLPPLPNLPYIYTSSSHCNHQEAHYACPLITTTHYPITHRYSYVAYIIHCCF